MKEAALKNPNIIDIIDEQLVSIDFNHTPYSAVFDTTQTKAIDCILYRVAAWYDNEWGFSNRMVDTAKAMAAFL
jgi:glyceraldehyde 3-phosphate dehydrogenase